LVQPGDAEALAEAIGAFLNDPVTAPDQSYSRVTKEVVGDMIRLFEQALERSHPCGSTAVCMTGPR
jgi:hypothetical protein